MLQKDLCPDQYEDNAARQLRAAFIARAEEVAHHHAEKRQHKRRAADEEHRRHDLHPQKSKRNADRKRIDTRRHGEEQQLFVVDAAIGLLLRCLAALFDHVAADEREQEKHNPMVDLFNIERELAAEKISQQRHQRLKAAEKECDEQRILFVDSLHRKALADRDGESVHRQTNGNQKQFKQRHVMFRLSVKNVFISVTQAPFLCNHEKMVSFF